MRRESIVVLVAGALALQTQAADNGPTQAPASAPGGYTNAPLVPPPSMQPREGEGGTCASCGRRHMKGDGCASCARVHNVYLNCGAHGPKCGLLDKWYAWIAFRLTVPCGCKATPSPYYPPLRFWFPCKENLGYGGGACSTCGNVKGRPHCQPINGCANCGAASLGAPVVPGQVAPPPVQAPMTPPVAPPPTPQPSGAAPATPPPQGPMIRDRSWKSVIGSSAQAQPLPWPYSTQQVQMPQPQPAMSPYGGTYVQPAGYAPSR